jgi:DNA-binding MurR/RpiR family transcriptional regulator
LGGPISYEQLINQITDRYEALGRRSRDIARYVVQNPNEIALNSAKGIAERIGVEASSLVRFAQGFGYSGFAEMQRIFQSRLLTAAPGYAERLEALKRELGGDRSETMTGLLRDLAIHDIASLQRLTDTVTERELQTAARLLARAPTVHVLGQMRSFPVAAYLRYLLTRLRRDVRLIDGAGGLATEQAYTVERTHVLVAVSFRYYAREVVDIAEALAARGVPIIAITDSQMSPITKHAAASFIVTEAENHFTRSLAAPICLAQALVIAMAREIRPDVPVAKLGADSLTQSAGAVTPERKREPRRRQQAHKMQ